MPDPGPPILLHRVEAGARRPLLIWRLREPVLAIASGPYGGGIGPRGWVLNASVAADYDRLDPDRHVAELAAAADLSGPGAGMLTAVDVTSAVEAVEAGVRVTATVGLGYPTLAAAPDEPPGPPDSRSPGTRSPDTMSSDTMSSDTMSSDTMSPGTINIVAFLPVRLTEAALVNAVGTATEAKTQALWECGVEATGTATDALFIGVARVGAAESYGGPRSRWGARLARAVHAAVGQGTRHWLDRHPGRSRPFGGAQRTSRS